MDEHYPTHQHLDRICGTQRELDGIREHFATYTPMSLAGPTGVAATAGTQFFGGTATNRYGIRTWHASSGTGSHTLTASIGADGGGTRVFEALVVTNNVPNIVNEWAWINSATGSHDIDANVSARDVALGVYGYLFA